MPTAALNWFAGASGESVIVIGIWTSGLPGVTTSGGGGSAKLSGHPTSAGSIIASGMPGTFWNTAVTVTMAVWPGSSVTASALGVYVTVGAP